jgi:hypothetical protein
MFCVLGAGAEAFNTRELIFCLVSGAFKAEASFEQFIELVHRLPCGGISHVEKQKRETNQRAPCNTHLIIIKLIKKNSDVVDVGSNAPLCDPSPVK